MTLPYEVTGDYMEFKKRKPTRIPGYNYAAQNCYFVTICTHEKRCIFGNVSELNRIGKIASDCIEQIPNIFTDVKIEKFVVMPNHVHAIVVLEFGAEAKQLPSLNLIVGQYKSAVTRKVHELNPELSVWQRSYHDHVIRNQDDFEKIWLYIEGNPSKWEEDCFFRIQQ